MNFRKSQSSVTLNSKNMSNDIAFSKTTSKELSITRLLNAPRELVWKVWTDPEHIKNWWGPMVSRIPFLKWK